VEAGCDAGLLQLLTDRAPMNAQLNTDLAKAPTLGVQVGRTRIVQRATVTSKHWHVAHLLRSFAQLPQHIRQGFGRGERVVVVLAQDPAEAGQGPTKVGYMSGAGTALAAGAAGDDCY
jgi:hypothetical protein